MKKIIIGMVSCFVFLFLFSSATKNVSAAGPYLNYGTYTLNGSFSVQLKLLHNTKKVTWSSSNKKVAKVTKKGKVTSVANGKCKIFAKVGKKKYQCRVTVKGLKRVSNKKFTKTTLDVSTLKLDVSGVGYDKNANAVIQAAKVSTFTVKLYNIPKKNKKTMKVKWSSSNAAVAKVSKGKITPIQSGNATITAKVNGKKYRCKVTVTDSAKTVSNNTLGDINSAAEQIDTQENIYEEFKLLNDSRIESKVAPVKMNEKLNQVAKIRVMECIPKDLSKTDETGLSVLLDERFSHMRPNGTAFSTAFAEGGIALSGNYTTGENLAHSSDRNDKFPLVAQAAFNSLWSHEEHKQNIVNKKFTQVGLGYYKAARFENQFGNVYIDTFWTQEFYGN